MRHCGFLPALILSIGLCACSDDPELPSAEPLWADPALVQQLYGANPGPLAIASATDLQLTGTGEQRTLAFNLYYPTTGQDYPLLLFSHGNWSNKNSYDLIIRHWVSHGYAVVAPDHLDCCSAVKGIFNSLRYGQVGLIDARVDDLRRLLEAIPAIEQLHPAFAGVSDPSRVAITGHSFGAFSAQQFGGATVFNPDTGQYQSYRDERVLAVVALSPPGPMFDTITADSWLQLSTPTLVTTGTWDIQPRFWPDWRQHLMSFDTARPADKYALVTQGADHYLGNLICRLEREVAPQHDALRMMQIATTAFLDAYLKGKERAKAFIAGDELARATGAFSVLSRRRGAAP
jgi:predicted dienelactone hydrolase